MLSFLFRNAFRLVRLTVILAGLLTMACAHYSQDESAWNNMSEEEREKSRQEIDARLIDASDNTQFFRDMDSASDWAGKGN